MSAASDRPVLRYGLGRRDDVRAALLKTLLHPTDRTEKGLRTRDITDPTVALLDSWATVVDIVSFYQERIANEGFLRTATEAGSILALAELVGLHPRPGLAATTWLAYTLNPDPADKAVVLPAAMVCQSVPGPGELPQAFETADELVARPSWNQLPVRRTAPPNLPHKAPDQLPQLVVQGAAPGIATNDVVLLDLGEAQPAVLRVRRAVADVMKGRTTLDLLPLHGDGQTDGERDRRVRAGPTERVEGQADPLTAVDNLIAPLAHTPDQPPATADGLGRHPAEVLDANTDLATRLVSVLQPDVGDHLYQALAMTPIGNSRIAGAQVLKGQGATFAAQIPPRQVFDRSGKVTTEDIPIAAQLLGLHVHAVRPTDTLDSMWQQHQPPISSSEVFVDEPGGTGRAPFQIEPGQPPQVPVNGGLPGSLEVRADGDDTWDVTYKAASGPASADLHFVVNRPRAEADPDTLTVSFDDDTSFAWQPETRANVRTVVGVHRLTVDWSPPVREGQDLTLTIERLRPLAQRDVLLLDGVYDKVVPGSTVLIDRPSATSPAAAGRGVRGREGGAPLAYPLARRVRDVDTTVVNEYGFSLKATRLILDGPWVDEDVVWLSQMRELNVRFESEPLELLPVPLGGEVAGTTIELDGLHPGIEPGRLLIVQGHRTDLRSGASAPAAECVMVAGTALLPSDPGAPVHTGVTLATPLAYSYERETAVVFGNVVAAHQGVTIVETPTARGTDPAHPTFTLPHAPVLADPAPSAEGARLALAVVVDGRRWERADRVADATSSFCYVTSTDGQGRTVITLGQSVPASAQVEVTYRSGSGAHGNLHAHQLTQLMTKPQAVSAVDNPLPASGGSDADPAEVVRDRVPLGLGALGRLVSVTDHVDLALSWAGIGKAFATQVTDGHRRVVALTVGGSTADPLEPAGTLISAIRGAVEAAGDGSLPVEVLAAEPSLIVVTASVRRDPAWQWVHLAAELRGALMTAFAYQKRKLGQDVLVSDLVAVAHRVPGVTSFVVTALGLIPASSTGTDAADLLSNMGPPPSDGRITVADESVKVGEKLRPVGLAYMSAEVPDTVLLEEAV